MSVDNMNLNILLFPESAIYRVLLLNATPEGLLKTSEPPNDCNSLPNALNLKTLSFAASTIINITGRINRTSFRLQNGWVLKFHTITRNRNN